MPGPVPIVSPVVPLFIAPLLIPVPGLLGRLAPVAASLVWLGLAGEIAESPIVVVEPVLALCARTNEFEKISAVAAITISFAFLQLGWNGSTWAMPRPRLTPAEVLR